MAKRITVIVEVDHYLDFDLEELKKEGITTKKQLLSYAKSNFDIGSNPIVKDAKIHDKYDDGKDLKPARRGKGSY